MLTAAVAALAFAAPNSQVILPPAPPWAYRAAAATRMPLPPVPVRVHLQPCPAYRPVVASCAYTTERPVRVYLGPGEQNPFTLYHEIGHVTDSLAPSWVRRRVRYLLRRRALKPLSETFAEAYAHCSTRDGGRDLEWGPTPAAERKVCDTFRAMR